MKPISLPIAELKPVLVGLAKAIQRHSALPILQGIKIERTSEGWITLTATDLDGLVTARLEQPAEGEPVVIVVAHDELLKTANKCAKEDFIAIQPKNAATLMLSYPVGNRLVEQSCCSYPANDFPRNSTSKGGTCAGK